MNNAKLVALTLAASVVLAAGPVSAYEAGSSPTEKNRSKLDTRPSSRPGTSRCFVVAQTIVPAVSKALKARQATAACQL